jgi:hypothetical protein
MGVKAACSLQAQQDALWISNRIVGFKNKDMVRVFFLLPTPEMDSHCACKSFCWHHQDFPP